MKVLKTILFILFCININAKSEDTSDYKNKFLSFLKNEIDKSSSNQTKSLVSLYFYVLNEKEYMRIVPYDGFFAQSYKGFCETADLNIFYYGFDDTLASRYISLEYNVDVSIFKGIYDNLENSEIDINPKDIQYYEIRNECNFERFYPDEKYEKELESYLYEIGYLISPPPPPLME